MVLAKFVSQFAELGRLVIVLDDDDSVEIRMPELGRTMIADACHDVAPREICRVSTDVPVVDAAEPCVTWEHALQHSHHKRDSFPGIPGKVIDDDRLASYVNHLLPSCHCLKF